MEQARVSIDGLGLHAFGHIISNGDDATEAYSVHYDVTTDDLGNCLSAAFTSISASGAHRLSLVRNADSSWNVDHNGETQPGAYAQISDIDVRFSPLFASLPIRRLELHAHSGEQQLSALLIDPVSLLVSPTSVTYNADAAAIHLINDDVASTLEVDSDGIVTTYSGVSAVA